MKKLLSFLSIVIPIIVVLIVVLTSSIVGLTVDIPVESIEIRSEGGVVGLNSSVKLEYEILPRQAHNQKVLFSSSDESVAIVDQEGNVSFIGFGKVQIVVTAVDGYKSKSCEFNVKEDRAYGINLLIDKKELVLDESFTAQLTASIFPTSALNKEISYSSSNPEIATVDENGLVTGLKPGTVTLTAKTVEEDIYQSLEIDVLRKPTKFEVLAENTLNSFVSEKEFVNLETKFYPQDTSEKYKDIEYTSSDTSIASINKKGQVIFNKMGKVDITAKNSLEQESSITLFYTGGLPNTFTLNIDSTLNKKFDEINPQNNSGRILINVNETAKNKVVSFKSSNDNVVEINEYGEYTILKGGYAVVTVTVKTCTLENEELLIKDETKEITFNITRDIKDILVDSFVSSTSNSYNIVSSVIPEDASNQLITFESLTPEIANVNNEGKVTFVKPGKAIIKLSSLNGEDEISKTIEIVSSFNYPTTCKINMPRYIKNNIITNILIMFDSTPIGGSNLYTFNVQDKSILEIKNDEISTKNTGTTLVTFTYSKWDEKSLSLVNESKEFTITVYENAETLSVIPEGLELSANGVFYTAKSKVKLSPKVIPSTAEYTIEYSIEDDSIASISKEGIIYFKNIGTTTFTIKMTDLSKQVLTKYVTIAYTANSPVSAELNIDKTQLWPNEKVEIKLNNIKPTNCSNPSYKITESGNILNINGNTITASKEGVTMITIEFTNGYKLYKEITVKTPVTDILFPETLLITEKDTIDLKVDVLPKNATNTRVKYDVSNNDICSINEKEQLVFTKPGTVTVSATALDNQGATSSITIESTMFNLKEISYTDTLIQGNFLQIDYLPVDYSGEYNLSIVDQTPLDGVGEDVIKLDKTSKKARASWPGTCTINLSTNGFTKDLDITVKKIEGDVVSFDISDLTLRENEEANIKINNIVTTIEDKEIEALLLKYIYVKYTNENGIEIVNNVVKAKEYGVYNVVATIGSCTVNFTINVLPEISRIGFSSLSIENINNDKYLTLSNQEIVTGKSNFNIGKASIISGTTSTTNYIEFSLSIKDSTIASIDNDGNINFTKDGIATILAKETITNKANPSLTYTSSITIEVANIRYTSKTESYTNTYNGIELLQDTNINFDYIRDDVITILHSNFIPKNPDFTANYEIVSEQPNHKGTNVIDIIDNKIIVKGGGRSTIKITINSKSYTYTFDINKKVTEINATDILTAKKIVDLNYEVLPIDANNKNVSISIDNSEIASIVDNNMLNFTKAGIVNVTITSTDGSNISKTIKVTSTFGNILDFELNGITDKLTINKGDVVSIINDYIKVTPKLGIASDFNFSISNVQANGGNTGNVIEIDEGNLKGLLGGTALVTISTTNAFGENLVKSFTVEVIEDVTNIVIDNVTLDKIENYYITSKNSYTFSAQAMPTTATNPRLSFTITNGNASIANSTVTFRGEGFTDIKISSISNPDIYKTIRIKYVGDTAINATVNTPSESTLNSKDTFTFKVQTISPSDFENKNIEIKVTKQTPNNGTTGDVIIVNNSTITCGIGGSATIEVYVNNFLAKTLNITVKEKATDITLEPESIILEDYTAQTRTYQINAAILPSSTLETISYELISGSNVSLSKTGLITLTGFTTATVKVKASESNIEKIFTITYKEKILKSIEISPVTLTKGALMTGESYTLKVIGHFDSKDEILNNEDVQFTSTTTDLIKIDSKGKVVAQNAYGTCNIQATYRGKDTTISFVVAPYVDLSLTLKEVDDYQGIKSQRVFGRYSFKSKSPTRFPITTDEINQDLSNIYQMNFTSSTVTYNVPIIWTSSNTNVATVDENGLVTRKTKGETIITCKPKYPLGGTEYAFYKFTFVDGIDIYNIDQFEACTTYGTTFSPDVDYTGISAKNHLAAVLHCDIKYTSSYKPQKESVFREISSIYGNGHTLDTSDATYPTGKRRRMFNVSENDVLIDNVTMIGLKYKNPNKPNLADFKDKPVVLQFRSINDKKQYPTKNCIVANSRITNGSQLIYASSCELLTTGCEFENSFLAGIGITYYGSIQVPTILTTRNCIYRNLLAGAIDIANPWGGIPEKAHSQVKVEGDFYLDNWRRRDDIPNVGGLNLDLDVTKVLNRAFDLYEDTEISTGHKKDQMINVGITILSTEGIPNVDDAINYGKVFPGNCADYLTPVEKVAKIDLLLIHMKGTMVLYGTKINNTHIPKGMTTPIQPGAKIDKSLYSVIRDLGV